MVDGGGAQNALSGVLLRFPRKVLLEGLKKGSSPSATLEVRVRKYVGVLFKFLVSKEIIDSVSDVGELRGSISGVLKRSHPTIHQVLAHLPYLLLGLQAYHYILSEREIRSAGAECLEAQRLEGGERRDQKGSVDSEEQPAEQRSAEIQEGYGRSI